MLSPWHSGFRLPDPVPSFFLSLGDAAALLLSSFLRCVPPSSFPPFYPRLTPPLTYLQEVSSSSSSSSSAQDAATLDKSVAGFAKFLVGSSVSLPNNQLKHQRKFFSEIIFGPLVISSMFPEIRLQLRPILPFATPSRRDKRRLYAQKSGFFGRKKKKGEGGGGIKNSGGKKLVTLR